MPSGHTDRETINQRRPLSPGMASMLRDIEKGRLTNKSQLNCDTSETSRLRGLLDRRLVDISPSGDISLTSR